VGSKNLKAVTAHYTTTTTLFCAKAILPSAGTGSQCHQKCNETCRGTGKAFSIPFQEPAAPTITVNLPILA